MIQRFLWVLILWLGVYSLGLAQNRSIEFEPKDWKKAVAKAKKENKLIFLDCYTSWCGPCKNLAKNIFTRDEVADFYNHHFINVSMDMEKDVDGVMLSKVYKPSAFPTLLFIDPYTELVVHQVSGAGDVRYILSIATEALKSDNTLAGSCKRYQNGERASEFVKKLMHDLKLAGVKEMHRTVSEAWFNGLKSQELLEKENWELFKAHIDNPFSEIFQKVVTQREQYEERYGKEEVALALQWVVIMEMGEIAVAIPNSTKNEIESRYRSLILLLNRMEFQGVNAVLTDLCFSKALFEDCGDAWRVIQNAYQYNPDGDEFYNIPNAYIYYPLPVLRPAMGDRIILMELLDLIDRIKLRCTSIPYLARLALDRYLILMKAGDLEGAEQAKTEYQQYCTMR